MKEKIIGLLKDLLQVVILSLIIVFIIFNFFFISVEVSGSSMEPNLLDGERGVSFIITKNLGIKRFNVVVIDSDDIDYLLVKRVIGLPNEKVTYKDNKLYINDEYIEEDFLGDVYTGDFEIELSDNEYYCLGDNRNVSRDSRFYGAFRKEEIKSTNIFVYYPFNEFGIKK